MDIQNSYFLTFEYNGVTKTVMVDNRASPLLYVEYTDFIKVFARLSVDTSLGKCSISGFSESGEAFFPDEQLKLTVVPPMIKEANEIIFKETPAEYMVGNANINYVDVYHLLEVKSIHTCAYFIEPRLMPH